MNHSMINSMVTMRALQQKLDVLANNMANLNTVGYKRKDATFEDIMTNMKSQPREFERQGRISPLGYNQGWGAKLSQVRLNLEQGPLNETNNPTDIAIEGNALFEIGRVTAGGAAVPLYTRDGSFHLAVDPADADYAYLATNDGDYVANEDGGRIRVRAGYLMKVDTDGTVSEYLESDPTSTVRVGRIQMVRPERPQYLQEIGDNLYAVPDGLDRNAIVKPSTQPQSELEDGYMLRQGFLEQSNVTMADEMTELLMVQRAYQMSSRAISSSDTMMGLVNNLRG